MAASGKIIDLRKLLAERFPRSPASTEAFLVTGLPVLDQAIGGGLPKNVITELISPQRSAGSASLIHGLLQAAQRNGYYIALIDGRDSFDPQPMAGSPLRHLLWIRCNAALHAIKATDLLLRDGNFPLLILDLVLNAPEELRKIPQTTWYRFQRLVEAVPAAFLVLTRQKMVPSAQLKIVLEKSWRLETLETDNAVSGLRFHVQRSHLGQRRSVVGGQWSCGPII
jgi:hypothetical protein